MKDGQPLMTFGNMGGSVQPETHAQHIDVRDPDSPLDVAEFAVLARAAIAGIAARGRPIVVEK